MVCAVGEEWNFAYVDISFSLEVAGCDIPLVNKSTKETSPAEALEHVGMVMPASLRNWQHLHYLTTQSTSVNWILNMGSVELYVQLEKNGTLPMFFQIIRKCQPSW